MKCSKFKSGSELNINNSMIQGLHIEPYDVHLDLHGVGPQVASQSLGGVPGHMNLPQHPQVKLEPLKLNKTYPST
jgi:hypothetical protein